MNAFIHHSISNAKVKNESNTVYVQTKTTNNNKMDLNIQAKGKGKQLTCLFRTVVLNHFFLITHFRLKKNLHFPQRKLN